MSKTFTTASSSGACCFTDGSRVVYATDGKADVYDMYQRRLDGTGDLSLLFESDENKNPRDWSSDGRYILYASQNSMTDADLWALPLFGDGKPIEVARTPFREFEGRFSSASSKYEPSPDGRRFLVNTVVSDASPITIILNWKAPASPATR